MDLLDLTTSETGNGVRKELIEYYKWVVNLATFVLSLSLSLAAFFPNRLHHTALLIAGWLCLGVCTFLNWLLIKGLVTLPLLTSTQEEQRGLLHLLYLRSLHRNHPRYGRWQNWLFLLGCLAIGLAFILELRS